MSNVFYLYIQLILRNTFLCILNEATSRWMDVQNGRAKSEHTGEFGSSCNDQNYSTITESSIINIQLRV